MWGGKKLPQTDDIIYRCPKKTFEMCFCNLEKKYFFFGSSWIRTLGPNGPQLAKFLYYKIVQRRYKHKGNKMCVKKANFEGREGQRNDPNLLRNVRTKALQHSKLVFCSRSHAHMNYSRFLWFIRAYLWRHRPSDVIST